MVAAGSATPLIGLDAVVIDTETTGLDAGKARLLEVAVVRIAGGRARAAAAPGAASCSPASRSRARPPPSTASTPPSSPTRRLCRSCGRSLPRRSASASSSATRSASIIAVLKRECQLAGICLAAVRACSTRGCWPQVAKPRPGRILARPGRQLARRRDGRPAFGARRCDDDRGRIPGPRAEAARARHPHAGRGRSRPAAALTDVLDQQHRAGWVEAVESARRDTERALGRIDSYPYRHRIRDVMSAPAKFAAAETSIGAALRIMAASASPRCTSRQPATSSRRGPPRPASSPSGTCCARWPRRVRRPSTRPCPAIMSQPARGRCRRRDFVYRGHRPHEPPAARAISASPTRPAACAARFPPATCCGCGPRMPSCSATSWMRRRTCTASAAPGRSCRRSPRACCAKACPGRDVAAVISSELGDLTRRAAVLAEQRLAAAGRGGAAMSRTRSPCSARPAAARACWPWTRTTPWCSPRAPPTGPRIAGLRSSARTLPTSCTRSACPTARAA